MLDRTCSTVLQHKCLLRASKGTFCQKETGYINGGRQCRGLEHNSLSGSPSFENHAYHTRRNEWVCWMFCCGIAEILSSQSVTMHASFHKPQSMGVILAFEKRSNERKAKGALLRRVPAEKKMGAEKRTGSQHQTSRHCRCAWNVLLSPTD